MRSKTLAAVLAAAATVIAGIGAQSASAFTNAPVGSTVTATLSSATWSMGTFMSCTQATLVGTVVSDAGPGGGGEIDFPQYATSGCTMFGSNLTVTGNTSPPWRWSVAGNGAVTHTMDFSLAWGALTARLAGTLRAAYTQTNGSAVISGSVTRVSGSSLIPATAGIAGTYTVRSSSGPFLQL